MSAFVAAPWVTVWACSDLLRLGLDAEMAVGQSWINLCAKIAAVFHDFPAENFNIDHVVISTQGVFAIETKGYAKPKREQGCGRSGDVPTGSAPSVSDLTTEKPLEQARRQAKWLGKWLSSAIGDRRHSVLALPGWYVERKGRGDVWIFSGKELPKLVPAQRPAAQRARRSASGASGRTALPKREVLTFARTSL